MQGNKMYYQITYSVQFTTLANLQLPASFHLAYVILMVFATASLTTFSISKNKKEILNMASDFIPFYN